MTILQRNRRRHTDQHAEPKTLGEIPTADGRWITLVDQDGTRYSGHLLEVEHRHDARTRTSTVLLRRFRGETPEDTRRGFCPDTPVEVSR